MVSARARALQEWACQKGWAEFYARDLKERKGEVLRQALEARHYDILKDESLSPDSIASAIVELRKRVEQDPEVQTWAAKAAEASARLQSIEAGIRRDVSELMPLIERPSLDIAGLCATDGGPDRRSWVALEFVEGRDFTLRCE